MAQPAPDANKYVVLDEQLGIAFGKSGALLFASSGGRYLYASNHVSTTRHLSDQQVARLEEFLSRHRKALGPETVASIRERYLIRRDIKSRHKQTNPIADGKDDKTKKHAVHSSEHHRHNQHHRHHHHHHDHDHHHHHGHHRKHRNHKRRSSPSPSTSSQSSSDQSASLHSSAAAVNVPLEPSPAREFAYAVE
jgi:ABC-type Zn2+ transport system substrate-binding protein/surface adhesin